MSELVLPGFEPTPRQLDAARACLEIAKRDAATVKRAKTQGR